MFSPSVTVAIVTARGHEHTSYDHWRRLRQAFLARRAEWTDRSGTVRKFGKNTTKLLTGEFGALLSVCLGDHVIPPEQTIKTVDEEEYHHTDCQTTALEAGTSKPHCVLIVDRLLSNTLARREPRTTHNKSIYAWTQPFVSTKEVISKDGFLSLGDDRTPRTGLCCSDKNTAIVLCPTSTLILLDDCCLPSFGLVETAQEICQQNKVLLIGHRKVYLPTEGNPEVSAADANWTETPRTISVQEAKNIRRVFGIWAMPVRIALALNGFNTLLDGTSAALDEELLERMDRYMAANNLEYALHPAARVYEIEHERPWTWHDGKPTDWHGLSPSGWQWKAPGSDLSKIRERVRSQWLFRYLFDEGLDDDDDDDDNDDDDDGAGDENDDV